MKKIYLFLSIAFMVIVACQQTPKVTPVDINAEEAALNELMDKIDASFKDRSDSTLKASTTEDVLICGTDPSEFWNKQQFLEQLEQMKQDTSNTATELKSIGDRKIKVAPDGNSAIVVTQYIISWSPKIPVRQVNHFVKTNDKWMIQFINVALIPKNEDLQKLNEAIE
jgi:hypothetical protein